MPGLTRRIRLLRWAGAEARAASLAAGVHAAQGPEAAQLAAELIDLAAGSQRHAGRIALRALAGAWSKLPAEAKAAAIPAGGARWADLIASMVRDPSPEPRRAAVGLIAAVPLEGMADQAALLLEDPDPATAEGAERAMVELVRLLARRDTGWDAAARRRVALALLAAVERFDAHRRAGVLGAVPRLAEWAGPVGAAAALAPLRRWLLDAAHPTHLAMRTLLRKSPERAARAGAWLMLGYDALASAAADRLAMPAPPADWAWALRAWHLGLSPQRAVGLRRLARSVRSGSAGLALPSGDPGQLSADARLGLAKWAAFAPLTDVARDEAAASLLADPEVAVRHAAARAAAESSGPRRNAALMDYCFDAHPRVARSAALAMLGARRAHRPSGADEVRIVSVLARLPDPGLRGLAAGLAEGLQPLAAVRVLLLDRDPAEDTTQARTLIAARTRAGGLTPAWIEQILQFMEAALPTCDGAPRTAAAAAAALVDLAVPLAGAEAGPRLLEGRADSLLRRAAGAADARVRANAVEAVIRRVRRAGDPGRADVAARWRDVVHRAIADDHHRVRAAGARALLVCPADRDSARDGRRALLGLLEDPRDMHRAAGLWLLERVADRVAESPEILGSAATVAAAAARSEPKLQARAQRAAARLAAVIRGGWARRAAVLSPAPAASAAGRRAVEAA